MKEGLEKEALLDGIEEVIESKIPTSLVINIVIVLLFVLVLLLPKIYVANGIYLSSIKINKLLNEYYSLKAENSILKSKIEKLKFKNRLNSYTF
jgi:cell division protein FtsB